MNALRIGWLQILENLRKQVHLVTLFLAIILLAVPSFVNMFAMGTAGFQRIAKDIGLTLISYYAAMFALYFGSTTIPKDIERKTIYPLLARPISRLSYVTGQFLGISVMGAVSFAVLGGCFWGALLILAQTPEDTRFFWAIYAQFLESSVLLAACMLFSTRTSPPLAAVMGMFTYIVGGLSNGFIHYFIVEDRENASLASLVHGVKGLLPNFEVFHIKMAVVHWLPLTASYMAAITCYALGWVVLLLLLTEFSFSRKDL